MIKIIKNLLNIKCKKRFFYVCTIGINTNLSFSINTFDIETTDGFPTINDCLELSKEKFPNQTNLTLVSITEITKKDWIKFISKQ
jgi:hypothetical protein